MCREIQLCVLQPHPDLRTSALFCIFPTSFGPPLLSAPSDSVQTPTPIRVMSDVWIQTATSSFLDTGCPHCLSSGVADPSGPLFPLRTKCLCPCATLVCHCVHPFPSSLHIHLHRHAMSIHQPSTPIAAPSVTTPSSKSGPHVIQCRWSSLV
jgi:hypothetical protein